jgi:hypothetical protein
MFAPAKSPIGSMSILPPCRIINRPLGQLYGEAGGFAIGRKNPMTKKCGMAASPARRGVLHWKIERPSGQN